MVHIPPEISASPVILKLTLSFCVSISHTVFFFFFLLLFCLLVWFCLFVFLWGDHLIELLWKIEDVVLQWGASWTVSQTFSWDLMSCRWFVLTWTLRLTGRYVSSRKVSVVLNFNVISSNLIQWSLSHFVYGWAFIYLVFWWQGQRQRQWRQQQPRRYQHQHRWQQCQMDFQSQCALPLKLEKKNQFLRQPWKLVFDFFDKWLR